MYKCVGWYVMIMAQMYQWCNYPSNSCWYFLLLRWIAYLSCDSISWYDGWCYSSL